MTLSRRTFLAGCSSALIAARANWAMAQTSTSTKKGLAGAAPSASGMHTAWYYNWGLTPSEEGMPANDATMRFVPMVWGWNPADTPHWLGTIASPRPQLLFGFNEPDRQDQSNVPVEQALDAWPSLEQVDPVELVGPSCAQPHGAWMQEFMAGAQSRGLRVDSVGFHHYGSPSSEAFIDLLEFVHQLYDRPLWVNEFAVGDWEAWDGTRPNRYNREETLIFMQEVCAFMENTPWVRGYSWYPWGIGGENGPLATSTLFDANGELNELGQAYAAI